MSRFLYTVYGLVVSSEICLGIKADAVGQPSVHIRKGAVQNGLGAQAPLYPVAPTVRFQVLGTSFLITIDSVARYLIKDGKEIAVDPCEGADPNLVRLFLTGSAFGVLLLQRGILPLHGSSVLTSHGAIIFCGASGHGKSTLAAAFAKRGYSVMSDDVSALKFTENGFLLVPSTPHIYLCHDALEGLDLEYVNLRRAAERDDKYEVSINHHASCQPVAVQSIYVLQPENVPSVILSTLSGFEKITSLINNTYRLQFIEPMKLTSWHFNRSTEIAARTRVLTVHRPTMSYQITELVDSIESDYLNC